MDALLFHTPNLMAAEECTYSGMVETVKKLRAELRELHDNCTVVSKKSPLPCKALIGSYISAVAYIGEKCTLHMHADCSNIIVEGVRWTKFWWYTPVDGWPTWETDVLGGLPMHVATLN